MSTELRREERRNKYPRWNLNIFDKNLFNEVLNFRLECIDNRNGGRGIARANWLTSSITMACDCASRRTRYAPSYRSKYWWSEEIAAARRACIGSKRRLTRARGKRNPVNVEELVEERIQGGTQTAEEID